MLSALSGIGAGGIVFLLFVVSFLAYQFQKPLSLSRNEFFRISPGQGVNEISLALQKQGIISRSLTFYWYTKLVKKDRVLQAGFYRLTPDITMRDLVSLFEKGSNVSIKVTFPEGFTIKQIVTRLQEQSFKVKEDDFARIPENIRASYPFLASAPAGASFEGFLFPDSYFFHADASFEDIIPAFLRNFQKRVNGGLAEATGKQKRSFFEVLTMASILERELQRPEDKKIAAGILLRRLTFGMPLQVDATINYVTGKNTPALSNQDIALDSPYNTYKYPGLPPGPIANPGLESIEAALFPEASDYWFYLSRQDNGQTVFSKTLKEHNVAKAKYLR